MSDKVIHSIHHTSKILSTSLPSFISVDHSSCIDRCKLHDYISLGCLSYVTRTSIARFVSIGSRVSIGGFNHEYRDCLSTFGLQSFLNKAHSGSSLRPSEQLTSIESDVWVGDNSVILSGVTLAVGSIVGAGSVVTKSTQPYSINVGNPSKPIKLRFDDCTINDLIESRWWTLETDQILPYLDMSPSLFLRSLSS